jgi:hypothetical protein
MLPHSPTRDDTKRLSAIKKRGSTAIHTTGYRMEGRGSISVRRQGFRYGVTTTFGVISDSKVIVKEAPF